MLFKINSHQYPLTTKNIVMYFASKLSLSAPIFLGLKLNLFTVRQLILHAAPTYY